jgi:hypothetical protein
MHGGRALALALLFACAAGCGGDEKSPNDQHAQLHGTVRDRDTGKHLSGVKIVFLSDTLDMDSTTSGKNGGYSLDVSSDSDSGHLEASKSGYQQRVVSVYLDSHDVEIDIDMQAGSSGADAGP